MLRSTLALFYGGPLDGQELEIGGAPPYYRTLKPRRPLVGRRGVEGELPPVMEIQTLTYVRRGRSLVRRDAFVYELEEGSA